MLGEFEGECLGDWRGDSSLDEEYIDMSIYKNLSANPLLLKSLKVGHNN